MAIDHLSLYQLTIEPGTVFASLYNRGKLRDLPDEDLSGDMYDLTQEICEKYGMPAYEVSNHAKPGAESRHNLIYWRYGDYVGIGPGAHGRVTLGERRYATEAFSNPDRWLNAVPDGSVLTSKAALDPATQADEYLMMSLRLNEGMSLSRYESLAGKALSASTLGYLTEIGMIDASYDRVKATQQGRVVLNSVIRELLSVGTQ